MTKDKKFFLIFVIAVVLAAAAVVYCIYEIRRYVDTHSWATIRISEYVQTENGDIFSGPQSSREVLKNDVLTVLSGEYAADITIDKVTHDGTVTMSFDFVSATDMSGVVLENGGSMRIDGGERDGETVYAVIEVTGYRYQ
ncbi:MAG: hypothetical protein IJ874_07000 [Ruminococcus sp.]|nr:hypothetical protein [Ruminococcus sp.]